LLQDYLVLWLTLFKLSRFARDQDAFFKQYAISFQKMIELSAVPLDSNPAVLNIPVHRYLFEEGSIVDGKIGNKTVPQPPATETKPASRNYGNTMSQPSSWILFNPWFSLALGVMGFFAL
jgi:hypothetical protein